MLYLITDPDCYLLLIIESNNCGVKPYIYAQFIRLLKKFVTYVESSYLRLVFL